MTVKAFVEKYRNNGLFVAAMKNSALSITQGKESIDFVLFKRLLRREELIGDVYTDEEMLEICKLILSEL